MSKFRRRLNVAALGAPISVLYPINVMSLSPIAYWPLNETSGTAAVNLVSTTLNGTYTACTLGQAQAPFVAPAFDGSTSFCDIYSAGLDGVFNGDIGTISLWAKVSGAGVWADGAFRKLIHVGVATTGNLVYIDKSTAANTLRLGHIGSSTSKNVSITTTATAWMHIAMTWTYSGDALIPYYNGSAYGSPATGLGDYTGALGSTVCAIGARDTAALQVWSGWLAHVAVWSTVLSPAQIANLYAWGL